jgi:hypothetical protein
MDCLFLFLYSTMLFILPKRSCALIHTLSLFELFVRRLDNLSTSLTEGAILFVWATISTTFTLEPAVNTDIRLETHNTLWFGLVAMVRFGSFVYAKAGKNWLVICLNRVLPIYLSVRSRIILKYRYRPIYEPPSASICFSQLWWRLVKV